MLNQNQELYVLTQEKDRVQSRIRNLKVARVPIQKAFEKGQTATGVCVLATLVGTGLNIVPITFLSLLAGMVSFSSSSFYLKERDDIDQELLIQEGWRRQLEKAVLKREEKGAVVSSELDCQQEDFLEQKVELLLDVMFSGKIDEETVSEVDQLVEGSRLSPILRNNLKEKVLVKREPTKI